MVYGDISLKSDYTSEDLNNILKKLYGTNFFDDIKLSINNNVLKIVVKEYPIINSVKVEGEAKDERVEKLLEVISSKKNSPFIKNILREDIETIKKLKERYKRGKITDKGKLFNTEIYEVLELGNMLGMAEIIAVGAINRKESRGGHSRTDYPKRDNENFLKHSLIYNTDSGVEVKYKPVIITKHQPAERTY